MAEPEPALKVEDIHKSFGNIEVLRGISLEAYDHNVISILGSSGSGKSTLLRCINLLETPTSGKVYFRGELIKMNEKRTGERVAEEIENRWNVSDQNWQWCSSNSICGHT